MPKYPDDTRVYYTPDLPPKKVLGGWLFTEQWVVFKTIWPALVLSNVVWIIAYTILRLVLG